MHRYTPERTEAAVETNTDLMVKLETALEGAGKTVGPEITGVIAEAGFYADHHIDMVAHIGAAPSWVPLQGSGKTRTHAATTTHVPAPHPPEFDSHRCSARRRLGRQ